MPTLTQYDFFTGTINLPNSAPTNPEGAELSLFIERDEQNYLVEVLGYELASKVIDAIQPLATPTQAISDLINGKEYTDKHGRLNKWPGFKTKGWSPIACFIYCKVMDHRISSTTGLGEMAPNTENMSSTSPSVKIVRAWNQMVELNWILDDFLNQNISDYPEYDGLNSITGGGSWQFFKKRNFIGI